MTETTAKSIQVRTGKAHETPNHRIKSTSASFGGIAASTLINGIVTIEAYDHNSGRRIHIDFCSPYQTETPVGVQADRMRGLADTLLMEAERLERLIGRNQDAQVAS